ncbi:MAG: hypothetical protein LBV67_12300 [Streptococcaceae bacterium]|nr:hypothetical protein [Streptococcaceae bacterium]
MLTQKEFKTLVSVLGFDKAMKIATQNGEPKTNKSITIEKGKVMKLFKYISEKDKLITMLENKKCFDEAISAYATLSVRVVYALALIHGIEIKVNEKNQVGATELIKVQQQLLEKKVLTQDIFVGIGNIQRSFNTLKHQIDEPYRISETIANKHKVIYRSLYRILKMSVDKIK